MKNIILLALLFILISIDLSAAVYRVNNTGADASFTKYSKYSE